MQDILIQDGLIIDGSGKPSYKANIGITEDKITYIGTEKCDAKQIVDASGKIVAPGFIDAHSHGDVSFGLEYAGLSKLSQGITTEITGQCGSSLFPILPQNKKALEHSFGIYIQKEDAANLDKFDCAANYKKHMKEKKLFINAVQFVGHNALRLSAMGFDDRKPTTEELETMKNLLKDAMEHGAKGMSSGLIYPPGAFADKEEMIELCKIVKTYDGIYVTHIRNESDNVEQAVEEAIDIAKKSGVRLWISHHKAMGIQNWGKVKNTVQIIEKERAEGVDICLDLYPYTAAKSNGYNMIAPRYMSEGANVLAEKLKIPEFRKEIKEDMLNPRIPYDSFYLNCGGFENISLIFCPATKLGEGMTIAEYAKQKGIEDPFDAFFDIMVENKGTISCCYKCISIDDIDYLIQKDYAALGTDSMVLESSSSVHPRTFGTFTYGYKRFVREKRFLEPEKMIYKITKFVADKFGLENRGEITEGNFADIVIFNPETIDGVADYVNYNALSNGIDYVLVNGQIAYENKKLTEKHAGRLLM